MIEVVYRKAANRVTVTGHAGAADKGEDLICSAATILARTLAADVERMQEIGALKDYNILLTEGNAEIRCVPLSKYEAIVGIIFLSITEGFQLLAEAAPEHVRFEIK